jgi:drug/metabolite transporter (DMT)-like permease
MKTVTILVLIIATLSAAIGETFLSYGMKSLGPVSLSSPSRWLELAFSAVKNVHLAVGVGFLACFFFLYLATLSWADFSFVLPITSLSFLFGIVMAKLFLHEQVSWQRWAGTLVILAGICLVASDHRERTVGGDQDQVIVKPPPEEGAHP